MFKSDLNSSLEFVAVPWPWRPAVSRAAAEAEGAVDPRAALRCHAAAGPAAPDARPRNRFGKAMEFLAYQGTTVKEFLS